MCSFLLGDSDPNSLSVITAFTKKQRPWTSALAMGILPSFPTWPDLCSWISYNLDFSEQQIDMRLITLDSFAYYPWPCGPDCSHNPFLNHLRDGWREMNILKVLLTGIPGSLSTWKVKAEGSTVGV